MADLRDDCCFQEWLHTALRAAVAEEATRRSVEGFLGGRQSREDTNWGWWPWRRKHTKEHHPNPSNPNITFDLDSSLEAVQLAALSYCEVRARTHLQQPISSCPALSPTRPTCVPPQPPKIISMNCTRCLQLPGLEPVVAVHDDSWNLQGYRYGATCPFHLSLPWFSIPILNSNRGNYATWPYDRGSAAVKKQ